MVVAALDIPMMCLRQFQVAQLRIPKMIITINDYNYGSYHRKVRWGTQIFRNFFHNYFAITLYMTSCKWWRKMMNTCRHGKTGGSGRIRVGSNGLRVKTGHGSKRVIFKRVNRVTGQTGCGSNGSDPFCHVYKLAPNSKRKENSLGRRAKMGFGGKM